MITPAAIQKNNWSAHSAGQCSRLYIRSLIAQQTYNPIAHNSPYQRIPPSPKCISTGSTFHVIKSKIINYQSSIINYFPQLSLFCNDFKKLLSPICTTFVVYGARSMCRLRSVLRLWLRPSTDTMYVS